MNRGVLELQAWMARMGQNQRKTATLLAVPETRLSTLLHGRSLPSLRWAVRIEAVTGIPCSSWVESVQYNSGGVIVDRRRKSHLQNTISGEA